MICPTAVGIDDDIALRHPIGRVRRFEFFQAGSCRLRYTSPSRHIVKPLAADFLAVRAPGHDGRMLCLIYRPENIRIDNRAVTQSNWHIFFKQNITGKRLGALPADRTGFKSEPSFLVLIRQHGHALPKPASLYDNKPLRFHHRPSSVAS